LITSYSIIGTRDTPVRAIIERAAQFVTVPQIASCYIVKPPRSLGEGAGGEGHSAHISGLYVGEPYEAWCSAADQSAREHVTYLDKPVQRVVSVMPPMYADLWTAAKGMYKTEPIVADGGEVILYAPQLNEISYTH